MGRRMHKTGVVIDIITLAVLAIVLLSVSPRSPAAEVPRAADQYRRDLIRNARAVLGLEAPIATLAAQIHQESGWRPDAKSAYASGLAQFTPATADWIGGAFPDELGDRQPLNPAWALRALVRYDDYLLKRSPGDAGPCHRWAFALAGYNGGQGWIAKDRKKTKLAGADDTRWWGEVERFNAGRGVAFFAENRAYPRLILITHEPKYVRAAWGAGVCA